MVILRATILMNNFLSSALCKRVGPNLTLTLVGLEDVNYIHTVRTDQHLNKYLSQTVGTVEDQRKWVQNYKYREKAGTELYYVIKRHDGIRCGLVRLYEISAHSFAWGSWILDHNKTEKAAWESSILSLQIGFELLKLDLCKIEVRNDNHKARFIYDRLGMKIVGSNNFKLFLEYSRKDFQIALSKWNSRI